MNHKDLEVWKKAMDLVVAVYEVSNAFPDTERYGLTQQMRRSAISIPSNIAEGAGRKGSKEFIQFVSIALGSLSELETQLILSSRLNYIHDDAPIMEDLIRVRQLLIGFRNHLQKNNKE